MSQEQERIDALAFLDRHIGGAECGPQWQREFRKIAKLLRASPPEGGVVPVGEVIHEAKFGCKAGQLFADLPIGTKLYTSPPAAASEAVAHSSLMTLHIDTHDKLDCCRRLLEIIALGDSADPVGDARQELIAHGFWNDAPLSGATHV